MLPVVGQLLVHQRVRQTRRQTSATKNEVGTDRCFTRGLGSGCSCSASMGLMLQDATLWWSRAVRRDSALKTKLCRMKSITYMCSLCLERRPYPLYHRISGSQLCPGNVNGTAHPVQHRCPLRRHSGHMLYQPTTVCGLSCLVVCL